MKSAYLFSLLFLIFISSCKKETGDSSEELLTGNPWKLSVYVLQYPNETPLDGFNTMSSCQNDDSYIFLEDNSYVILDNGMACPGINGVREKSVWTLSEGGKKLQVGSAIQEVIKLTADSLVLQEYSVQYTWTKTKRYAH